MTVIFNFPPLRSKRYEVRHCIKDNKLVCPECKKKHKATDGQRTFPQNKYILANIRKKNASEPQAEAFFERCKENGKKK